MENNQANQRGQQQPVKSKDKNEQEETQKEVNKFLNRLTEEDKNLSGEISGDKDVNMDAALSTGGDLTALSDMHEEPKDVDKIKQKSHAENVGGTSEEDIRLGRD